MPRRLTGFTLLELLVVLAILALAAAVATPQLSRMVTGLQAQERQDRIVRYLQTLPVAVMREARTRTLPQTPGYLPASEVLGTWNDLPEPIDTESLQVWIPRPIIYRANGACSGGVTHWQLPNARRITLELAAPICRPQPRS